MLMFQVLGLCCLFNKKLDTMWFRPITGKKFSFGEATNNDLEGCFQFAGVYWNALLPALQVFQLPSLF